MGEILTSSRLKAFRLCNRLHQYRYLVCRSPVSVSGPARFGNLFHVALQHWWLAWQLTDEERLGVALHALRNAYDTSDEEEQVTAEELLFGYHLRWGAETLVTELAEHEFVMPLVNPDSGRSSRTYQLRGKIDAKVFDPRDDRHYLVEHKTTTSDITEGSTYWSRLRMDGQVSVYYDAFPGVAGCIYDVIRRPLLRRLKATPTDSRRYTAKGALYAAQRLEDESLDDFRLRTRKAISDEPDAYYKRGVVVRLDSEKREYQLELWHQAKLMRDLRDADIHPRNVDACIQYNRPCDYFDVCTGAASIDDNRLFQLTPTHPELSSKEAM